MSKFGSGRQPCALFRGRLDAWGGVNEHECVTRGCEATVSFCESCHYDHHANGYESCPKPEHEGLNGEPCEFCPAAKGDAT